MKVSWDDDIPNIWKVIKFHGSKPQTSIYTNIGFPLPLTIHYLVGGFNHLEKYEFVNGKDYMYHILWKIKKCSKPPTSYVLYLGKL